MAKTWLSSIVIAITILMATTISVTAAPHSALLFMPASCATPSSLANRTCCPSYNDQQCGGPVRGTCMDILEDTNTCVSDFDMTYFFSEFFDFACVCEGNYYGPSCGECKPGWTGDLCNEAVTMRVRRPFENTTLEQRETVLRVFMTLKQTPHPYWPEDELAASTPTESWAIEALNPTLIDELRQPISCYDWLVALHYYGMWPSVPGYLVNELPGVQEYAHGAALLPWHRRITWEFEKLAQWILNDPTWSMPYWDASAAWAGQTSTDPMLGFIGGSGNTSQSLYDGYSCDVEVGITGCNCSLTTGPFAPWRTIRQFGLPTGDLPLQRSFGCFDEFRGAGYSDVGLPTYELIGNWTTFPDFLQAITVQPSWHTPPHNFFGYTMLAGSSPSDPAFYFIHSWVDFVFEKWIRHAMETGRFGIENMNTWSLDVGQARDECGIPFFPLQPLRDWFHPTFHYGYTYQDWESTDPAVTTDYPLPDPYAFNSTTTSSSSGPSLISLSKTREPNGRVKRLAHRARVAAEAEATAALRAELDATLTTANQHLAATIDRAATAQQLKAKTSSKAKASESTSADSDLSHMAAKKQRQHSKKHRLLRTK